MRLLLPATDNLVIYFNLWMCFTTQVSSRTHTHTHAGGGRRHACRLGVLVDCRARNQTNNLLIIGRPRSLLSQFNGPGQNAVSGPLVLTQHKNTNLKVPISQTDVKKKFLHGCMSQMLCFWGLLYKNSTSSLYSLT